MRKICLLSFLLALALAACANPSFTPEQAARSELIEFDNAQADTVRIHQNQHWQGRPVVLASSMGNAGGEISNCEAVFEMEHSSTGWRVRGSGIGCSSPPSAEAVTFGSGTQGVPPEELSYAYGLVRLDAAQWVEITWQDGSVQRAEVINASYLVLRAGAHPMIARVEVFNAADDVIHEIEIMPDVEKLP